MGAGRGVYPWRGGRPIGPSGADLAGVGTLPVTAGLGLDGPAALDAARAILVATLTAGSPDDPDAQGRAVIPGSTLATLLGVSAVDLGPMHRLTVAPTFADALTTIEAEIIRRSRVIADAEAADVVTLREQAALAEPLPQLLLIADVPDPAWHARLATAVRLGKTVDIGTVLIGSWPHGTVLTIAADGITDDSDRPRVAVLDTAATAMLAMLREAHGDTEPADTKPAGPGARGTEPAGTAAPTRSAGQPPAPQPGPAALNGHGPPISSAPAGQASRPDDADADHRVVVQVLGDPAILDADGKPVRGLRAKSLELLVYLAVHRGGAALPDIMEAI